MIAEMLEGLRRQVNAFNSQTDALGTTAAALHEKMVASYPPDDTLGPNLQHLLASGPVFTSVSAEMSHARLALDGALAIALDKCKTLSKAVEARERARLDVKHFEERVGVLQGQGLGTVLTGGVDSSSANAGSGASAAAGAQAEGVTTTAPATTTSTGTGSSKYDEACARLQGAQRAFEAADAAARDDLVALDADIGVLLTNAYRTVSSHNRGFSLLCPLT